MTVAELSARLTVDEWLEWVAHFQLKEIDAAEAEMQARVSQQD